MNSLPSFFTHFPRDLEIGFFVSKIVLIAVEPVKMINLGSTNLIYLRIVFSEKFKCGVKNYIVIIIFLIIFSFNIIYKL